jgi:predicted ATPase
LSIQHIRIENFKKFSDITLDLTCPITLIYGENSSGKSSALRAILGLVQTFSQNNKYQSWNAQGELVDLGLYKDYIKDHNVKNKFSISLQSHLYSPYEFKHRRNSKARHVTEQKFTYEYDSATSQAKIHSFHETTTSLDSKVLLTELINHGLKGSTTGPISPCYTSIKISKPKTRSHYNLTVDGLALRSSFGSPDHAPDWMQEELSGANTATEVTFDQRLSISETNEKKKHKSGAFMKLRLYERAIEESATFLSRVHYLGPLRMSPLRSYKLTSHTSEVGPTGELTPLVLSYLYKKSQQDKTKSKIHKLRYEKFCRWFQYIFPDYEISVEPSEDVVRLKVKHAGRTDSITDVGFGFSQVLPILVQASAMESGDTLIIEQPELHLHPKAQVAFSTFVTEASKSGVKFIIETHSEHLLRGLQLNISNHELDPQKGLKSSNVKIYYFHREDKITNMTLNQWGEIEGGWPEGFFDESYQISSQILKNKISAMTANTAERKTEASE